MGRFRSRDSGTPAKRSPNIPSDNCFPRYSIAPADPPPQKETFSRLHLATATDSLIRHHGPGRFAGRGKPKLTDFNICYLSPCHFATTIPTLFLHVSSSRTAMQWPNYLIYLSQKVSRLEATSHAAMLKFGSRPTRGRVARILVLTA